MYEGLYVVTCIASKDLGLETSFCKSNMKHGEHKALAWQRKGMGKDKTKHQALTSELSSSGAVGGGLPAVLVLFKLLHPTHVEPTVPFRHIQDQQLKNLPLLYHRQLQLGPWETLCVVAIETSFPHVDTGNEEFVLWSIGVRRQEGPLNNW